MNRHIIHSLILSCCVSSSSELRAGGPPVGARPAEDKAGRHAVGRPGPDLTPGPQTGTDHTNKFHPRQREHLAARPRNLLQQNVS